MSSFQYIRIHKPNHPMASKQGLILEHRFVMSEYLGRNLDESEVVHHINHNKRDNRIENLEILTTAEHIRKHTHLLMTPEIRKRMGEKISKTKTGIKRESFTPQAKKNMSRARRTDWERGVYSNRPNPSEETRVKMSQTIKKIRANKFWSSRKAT